MSIAAGTYALLAALRDVGCKLNRPGADRSSIVVYLDFEDWSKVLSSLSAHERAWAAKHYDANEFSVNGVRFRHRTPQAGRVDARKEGA